MITPLSPSSAPVPEEDEDHVGFGSHNMYAPDFSLFSALPHFPWDDFFASHGVEGTFPAVIYVSEQGEQLYTVVTQFVDQLSLEPSLQCTVGLSYQEGEQGLEGRLEVELLKEGAPSLLELELLATRGLLKLLLQAVARHVAGQIHADDEPIPSVVEHAFSPLAEGGREGVRGEYTLYLPTE